MLDWHFNVATIEENRFIGNRSDNFMSMIRSVIDLILSMLDKDDPVGP